MNHHAVWFGFWMFMCAAALAVGMGHLNRPSVPEINALAKQAAAKAMAERGASPVVIQCILNPPTFSNRCYEVDR